MKSWLGKLLGKSQQPAPTPAESAPASDRTIPINSEQTIPTDADRTIPISAPAESPAGCAAEAPVAMEWQVGDVIRDLYEIKEIHGGGGMRLVYRAHRRDWEKEMAVKSPRAEYFQSEQQKENFVRECLTWIGLGLHAHIVCCYYVRMPRDFRRGVDPMEVVLGGRVVPIRERDAGISKKLAEVIDRSLAVNPKERYQDAAQMLDALGKAL